MDASRFMYCVLFRWRDEKLFKKNAAHIADKKYYRAKYINPTMIDVLIDNMNVI